MPFEPEYSFMTLMQSVAVTVCGWQGLILFAFAGCLKAPWHFFGWQGLFPLLFTCGWLAEGLLAGFVG